MSQFVPGTKVTQHYLTTKQKHKFKPIIQVRDGINCFYCKNPFDESNYDLRTTFDHLDDNPIYNMIQNLVLCHRKCNSIKKYNFDYQIMAKEKIRSNFEGYGGERITNIDTSTNEQINESKRAANFTRQYLLDRLLPHGEEPAPERKLEAKMTIRNLHMAIWDEFGHGSDQAITRYVLALTSEVGPLQLIEEEDGRKYIIKRNDGR